MKHAVLIVLAACLAAPAIASDPKPAKAERDDPDRIICRKIKATGSLTRMTKDCRTARDWAELRQASREATENLQVLRANGEVD